VDVEEAREVELRESRLDLPGAHLVKPIIEAWAEYRKAMQALDLAIPSGQRELDLPQTDDIRINDTAPVMRATGNQIELVPMTFAFPPARPGGAPVFNFRSGARHFANSNRCLIPASAFFEFTGKKYPKAKHRFALKGSPITAIAGLTVRFIP
jgi:putative SOS response-associated peptidase YedK